MYFSKGRRRGGGEIWDKEKGRARKREEEREREREGERERERGNKMLQKKGEIER
uniref:Uncharacterized protein n=1 Tax=Octopus bimaculoides TaxID=37653 RepID=A0A0L8FVU4_OCTBM